MTQDRKDLKIQALLEKVSSLTTNYENQIADLRVDLTVTSEALGEAQQRLSEYEQAEEPTDVPSEDADATDDTD